MIQHTICMWMELRGVALSFLKGEMLSFHGPPSRNPAPLNEAEPLEWLIAEIHL